MKYFLTTHHWTHGQNKLELAIKEAMREFNRYCFDPKELPRVKSAIENVLTQLNKEHKACHPKKFYWQEQSPVHTLRCKIKDLPYKDWTLYFDQYNTQIITIVIGKEDKDL